MNIKIKKSKNGSNTTIDHTVVRVKVKWIATTSSDQIVMGSNPMGDIKQKKSKIFNF